MKYVIVFSAFLSTMALFSQTNGSVRGTILDRELNDEPLMMAQVDILETAWSGETNLHGNFEIEDVEPGNYTLVISYLGYENVAIPIAVKADEVTEIQHHLRAKSIGIDPVSLLESKDGKAAELSALE